MWVVSVWDSAILCDKAVYVINWYEISQSRKFVVALGH